MRPFEIQIAFEKVDAKETSTTKSARVEPQKHACKHSVSAAQIRPTLLGKRQVPESGDHSQGQTISEEESKNLAENSESFSQDSNG